MYKATINNHSFEIEPTEAGFLVNNKTNYILTVKETENESEKYSVKDIDTNIETNAKQNNLLQASEVTK